MLKVIHNLSAQQKLKNPVALAIGFFDGVHRGHQAVIAQTIEAAHKHHGESWVLTFTPHPLKVIRPELAPPMLTSTNHKLKLLTELGLTGCMLIKFGDEFRQKTAEEFVALLLNTIPNLKCIIVGENWRFGKGATGTAESLKTMLEPCGIEVVAISSIQKAGDVISSTRIRQLVREGKLDEVAKMLGRPFSIIGDVVHGRKIGRELGFPTANVFSHSEVHPPDGVYAARVIANKHLYNAAAYIGKRPTFNEQAGQWFVEVHLLDAELDLYNNEIEVIFIEHLRNDIIFDSSKELIAQINEDITRINQILTKVSGLQNNTPLAQ